MPGIFGVLAKRPLKRGGIKDAFNAMSHCLIHQTWYKVDRRVVDDSYALGSVFLQGNGSISEVRVGAKEYIFIKDGLVYEVDGHKLKKAEDPALKIISGVSREGTSFLPRICGNYTIAILTKDTREFLLFNDRMGPWRIYYADLAEAFVFAPEVKAISFLPWFKRGLDWKGLADFFNYGYVIGDNTFFRDIKSLSSASVVKLGCGNAQAEIEKYWKPTYREEPEDLHEITERGYSLVRSSVAEKVSHAESVISPISGGLDSRLILATLKEINTGKPVKPITYGQPFSYEYKNACHVCKALDMRNHALVEITPEAIFNFYSQAVWLSEGMVPGMNCLLLLLPLAVGREFKCLLNGIYGGPTNYDALYYNESHVKAKLSHEDKAKDIAKDVAINQQFYSGIFAESSGRRVGEQRLQSISDELKKHLEASDKFCFQRDAFFIENRMRRFINQSSLYRFYWQEQLPLSKYDLYDFYLSTPAEVKLHRNLLKTILKVKFPAMARIPDANTGLNLYQEGGRWRLFKKRIEHDFKYYATRLSHSRITFYDKSTYGHFEVWFRKHRQTRELYRKHLFSEAIQGSGLFDGPKLEEHFDRVANGAAGFDALARLVTFSIWYKLFVVGEGVADVRERLTKDMTNFR